MGGRGEEGRRESGEEVRRREGRAGKRKKGREGRRKTKSGCDYLSAHRHTHKSENSISANFTPFT